MLNNLKHAGQGVLWLVATAVVAALLGFISQLLTGDPFWLAQYTPNELAMVLVGTLFQIVITLTNGAFWYQPWPSKTAFGSDEEQHWTDRLAFWVQLVIVAGSWFAAARIYTTGDHQMAQPLVGWGIAALFAFSILEKGVFRAISWLVAAPFRGVWWVLSGAWKKVRGARLPGSGFWNSWIGGIIIFIAGAAVLFGLAMVILGLFQSG